jgi:multiple sugar transport system substrate-binding protein
MNGQLTRRGFLKTATLSGIGLVLVACAPAAAPGGQPAAEGEAAATGSERTELAYWHSWTEQWEEMTQFVCDRFNEKYPELHATQTVVPGQELITKLLSSVAAGNPPDMITVYSAINIPSLVEQSAILALDDYDTGSDLSDAQEWFHPAVLDLGTYNGKLWGLSYWQQTSCIGWNKQIFEEAGLDPDTPPTSIEELDAMAEQLTVYEGDLITRMGHMPFYYWMWAAPWGGSFYDADNRTVTANAPENVAMFEWMASYSQKYDVTKVQAFEQGLASERAGVLDPFISGRIAIHEVGGAWKLGDFAKYAEEGFSYGIIPAPTPGGSGELTTYSYGDLTVVPTGTKHPAEAWQFVKYTGGLGGTLDDYFTVLTWGNRPINVPVTNQMLEHEPFVKMLDEYPGFREMVEMFLNGDRVLFPPEMPVGTFYEQRLNAARDNIRLLEGTPQEILDQVTDEVQQELDQYYEQQG